MCGLVGIAGRVNQPEEKMFKRMLELDTIRGPHSTGIVSVNRQRQVSLIKKVGTPWDLYQYKGYDDIMRRQHSVLLGHNRWATKGAVNAVNAHPFVCGDLIGMHNGTLRNQSLLLDHRDFDVDSENIYHHMNEHGVSDTVAKMHGAFALTWYNKADHTLNFIRNSERPLWGAAVGDAGATLAWASEPFILHQAAAHAGLKIQTPILFDELDHVSINVNEMKGASPVLDKPRYKKLNAYEPPPVVVHHSSKQQPLRYLVAGGAIGTTTTTPTSKSAATVKTISTGQTTEKPDDFAPVLSTYKDTMAEIEIVGPATAASGQPYIQAVIFEEEQDMEVRLYLTKLDKRWTRAIESTNLWDVYIKNITKTVTGHVYAVGDLRSLEEVVLDDDEITADEEEWMAIPDNVVAMYPGNNDSVLTMDEWEENTNDGCSWCGDPISVLEAFELAWFETTGVLCSTCSSNNAALEAVGLEKTNTGDSNGTFNRG